MDFYRSDKEVKVCKARDTMERKGRLRKKEKEKVKKNRSGRRTGQRRKGGN